MELLHPICSGLDVHKDSVVACVRTQVGARGQSETRTFGTCTTDLLQLCDWLQESGCTAVGMEATGVYWKPVWHILEGSFELILANAGHIKNVPGRKSDVSDAAWIADLVAHGLIRPSFVPTPSGQQLRDLTRTRKQFVRQRAQHTNRIQKVLEDANIKLGSVVTDVLGASGRAILDALVDGITDPEHLADLASPRIKAGKQKLTEALRGKVTAHHRFLLRMHLEQVDATDRAVREIEAQIEALTSPFDDAVERLTTIPGVSRTAAAVIIAEIGLDMSRFPSAAHLVSFAGLCPRLDETAGKKRSTRLRKGSNWLKCTLVSCAWAATHTKDTYARAQYYRIRTRRGHNKAVVAVAAGILVAVYHMLTRGTAYQDLGPTYFDTRNKERTAKRLQRRLEDMGYQVALTEAA